MKQKQTFARPALGLLLAAAALPFTPAFAQDAVPATEPPIVDVTPPPIASPPPEETAPVDTTTPAPTIATPPPAVTVQPRLSPPPAIPEATTRQTRTTERSVSRAAPAPVRTRTAAPVSQAAPVDAAPAAGPAPLAASPPAETLPAETLPAETLPVAEAPAEARTVDAIWPWLALGALFLVGAIVLLARRRRRTSDEVFEETAYAEPVREERIVPAAEPLAAAPVAFAAADQPATVAPVADDFADRETFVEQAPVTEAATEEIAVTEPDPEDVAILAAASAPAAGRPWIEFLMRPVRAGMNDDEAVVEFDLTVGNTGSEPARDVRIATFMFAAGSAQESDMERMLIDPPAEATVSEGTIDAGDGARVEASMTLPKAGLSDAVLPVVVADARYTLPDGSEGRTTASFEIGVPDGEDMAYFSVDNPSGLHEDIEARLRGELQRA